MPDLVNDWRSWTHFAKSEKEETCWKKANAIHWKWSGQKSLLCDIFILWRGKIKNDWRAHRRKGCEQRPLSLLKLVGCTTSRRRNGEGQVF